jgi:hypothetical protein
MNPIERYRCILSGFIAWKAALATESKLGFFPFDQVKSAVE